MAERKSDNEQLKDILKAFREEDIIKAMQEMEIKVPLKEMISFKELEKVSDGLRRLEKEFKYQTFKKSLRDFDHILKKRSIEIDLETVFDSTLGSIESPITIIIAPAKLYFKDLKNFHKGTIICATYIGENLGQLPKGTYLIELGSDAVRYFDSQDRAVMTVPYKTNIRLKEESALWEGIKKAVEGEDVRVLAAFDSSSKRCYRNGNYVNNGSNFSIDVLIYSHTWEWEW